MMMMTDSPLCARLSNAHLRADLLLVEKSMAMPMFLSPTDILNLVICLVGVGAEEERSMAMEYRCKYYYI